MRAICNSRHFNKLTRIEFQACMREALWSAKQRYRISTRVHKREHQVRMWFWNQERENNDNLQDNLSEKENDDDANAEENESNMNS